MDDRFLNELRRDPPADLARNLGARLRAEAAQPAPHRRGRVGLVAALAAVAAALIAVVTVPSMRVSAESFLDLFRVRRFQAVSFDPARLDRVRALRTGDGPLVFDRQQRVGEPGPPRAYPSLAAAAAAAGVPVRRPTWVPNGLTADSVFVQGDARVRLGVDSAKLRAVLDALDLRDVTVPPGLDGRWIDVHKPPLLVQRYRGDRGTARFVEAQSPEVSVPAGVDVPRLAEIGLRVLGLDAGEARRVAQATDWRGTLLVPVPVNATTFREVTVHGQPGLLVTTTGEAPSEPGRRRRPGSIVLWTEADRVFAVTSSLSGADALQMAESVQ